MTRKVILILGKTGQGKSTLSKHFFKVAPRVIVFDPLEEYEDYSFLAQSAHDVIDYMIKDSPEKFKISFRSMNEVERDSIFQTAWTIGNVLVIVEEADLYLEQKNKYFDSLVEQGRHRNVSLVCVVRRTPEVKRNFRALQTSLFSFFQDEPNDLKHLQEWGFSLEGIQALHPVNYPNPPKQGVNYLVIGENLEEIDFKKADRMSSKSLMEL